MKQQKSQRQLQIGEQIKRSISDIFLRQGLLTIMNNYITILEADVSPDIKNVRIYIDIFGDEKLHEQITNRLNEAAPHFRHELGKRLTSRNTPEIEFVLDKTERNASKIDALINKENEAFLAAEEKAKKKSTANSAKKSVQKKSTNTRKVNAKTTKK